MRMLRALRFRFRSLCFFVFVLGVFSIVPLSTWAAELYITPGTFSTKVDEIFTVRVAVRSLKEKLNAVEGSIAFPPDIIEVVSFLKGGSIISAWAEEPSFSNEQGLIAFTGGIPGGGFSGSDALLLQITFRAKAPGTAGLT